VVEEEEENLLKGREDDARHIASLLAAEPECPPPLKDWERFTRVQDCETRTPPEMYNAGPSGSHRIPRKPLPVGATLLGQDGSHSLVGTHSTVSSLQDPDEQAGIEEARDGGSLETTTCGEGSCPPLVSPTPIRRHQMQVLNYREYSGGLQDDCQSDDRPSLSPGAASVAGRSSTSPAMLESSDGHSRTGAPSSPSPTNTSYTSLTDPSLSQIYNQSLAADRDTDPDTVITDSFSKHPDSEAGSRCSTPLDMYGEARRRSLKPQGRRLPSRNTSESSRLESDSSDVESENPHDEWLTEEDYMGEEEAARVLVDLCSGSGRRLGDMTATASEVVGSEDGGSSLVTTALARAGATLAVGLFAYGLSSWRSSD
jgi:hypothetical protein